MAQPETSGRREPGSEEWQRPWETSRDRSTFALGFAAALVTDVFVDLSRTLLLALRLGSVQNPPAYSSDATIRPGDLYFLHLMMHGAHDAAIKAMCSLGIRWRELLQRFLWLGSGALLVLLLVVHLAFVNPSTQLSASRNLSALLETYCSQEATWLLHLELLETWTRPTNWTEIGEEENATLVNILKRLGDLAHLGYEAAFPRPSYELASDSSWLAVRSRNLRRGQVSTHHLQLSTENASLFGPRWARTLQSTLGLHDIYVLHALSPLKSPCEGRLFVWVASGSAPLRLSPAGGGVLVSVVQTLAFMSSLAVACVLFSSFLRSFLVLSMRTYVNNRFCLLQLQRFAFISQAMRRVNRAPASMLLELWVATSASALLLLWRYFWRLGSGPWCGLCGSCATPGPSSGDWRTCGDASRAGGSSLGLWGW
ncbi:unnamed protein product [Effrenium voratum]|nr:unnamed protein product [Effrenium voratum]